MYLFCFCQVNCKTSKSIKLSDEVEVCALVFCMWLIKVSLFVAWQLSHLLCPARPLSPLNCVHVRCFCRPFRWRRRRKKPFSDIRAIPEADKVAGPQSQRQHVLRRTFGIRVNRPKWSVVANPSSPFNQITGDHRISHCPVSGPWFASNPYQSLASLDRSPPGRLRTRS